MKELSVLLISNLPDVAAYAFKNGVNRVFVDMEHLGKEERQPGQGTIKNSHTPEDIRAIRQVCPGSDIMVRINPFHDKTVSEVESVIKSGASMIMLPMCTTLEEIDQVARYIDRRVKFCPLIETWSAVESISQIASHENVDELYFGLNDLAIASHKRFMFQSLIDGSLSEALLVSRDCGKPFGIGGTARIGSGVLPADLIVAEHARIGSTRVILSQAFHGGAKTLDDFKTKIQLSLEIDKIKRQYQLALEWPIEEIEQAHRTFVEKVKAITDSLEAR